jgi:hypothetical protein
MSLSDEQAVFLLDACVLIQFATAMGFKVTGGELTRPLEMQKIYVQTGRSKTMKSNHIRRLAIDLNFILDGQLCYDAEKLKPIGLFWESLNPKNRWGGFWSSFKDMPHFERNL